MKNQVTINNQKLEIKEYQKQRVVTFNDIDIVHQRKNGTAHRNFKANRDRFIEGEDYYKVTNKDVGTNFVQTYGFDKKAPSGILLTESGYLMLVKSFTDDLAWEVQRKLVNSYFRVKDTAKQTDKVKEQLAEARQRNARAREASIYLKLADRVTVETYRQILISKSAEVLAGQMILPLPTAPNITYSAKDIGDMLGISGNMVGRLANKYGLKTEEFGEMVWDKSQSSAHQCQTFRYYISVVPALKKVLDVEVA